MKSKLNLKPTLSETERAEQRRLRCILLVILIALLVMLLASCHATGSRQEGALLGLALWGSGIVATVVLGLALRKQRAVWRLSEIPRNDCKPFIEVAPAVLEVLDLQHILTAVTAEVCAACEHVRKAQKDLSVEDYGEKLGAAEDSLRKAIQCLGSLLDQIQTTGGKTL